MRFKKKWQGLTRLITREAAKVVFFSTVSAVRSTLKKHNNNATAPLLFLLFYAPMNIKTRTCPTYAISFATMQKEKINRQHRLERLLSPATFAFLHCLKFASHDQVNCDRLSLAVGNEYIRAGWTPSLASNRGLRVTGR
jgi:hypothetical protein